MLSLTVKQHSKSQSSLSQRWVKIGTVGKAHGLQGAFFVSGRDGSLDPTIQQVRIGPALDKSKPYKVLASRMQAARPLVQCEDVTSRDAAESLCNLGLWCLRHEISLDDDSEYLWDDLMGRTLYDKDEVSMGEISAVVNYGATDIIEVRDPKGRSLSIPFVDAYIRMDFEPAGASIWLKVSAEIFAEAWEEPS